MKFAIYFVIGVVAVNAVTDNQKLLIKDHIQFCSEKIGIPVEESQTLLFNVLKGETEKYKCFSKCFLEQTGFLTSDGMVQRDVIVQKLSAAHGDEESDEKINELIDTCTSLVGSGECGTAHEITKCYFENISPNSRPHSALTDPDFLD